MLPNEGDPTSPIHYLLSTQHFGNLGGEELAPDCLLRRAVCSAEKPACNSWEIRSNWPVIARVFHAKRAGESVLLNMPRRPCSLFLRRASEQSGFNDSIRRIARGILHAILGTSPRAPIARWSAAAPWFAEQIVRQVDLVPRRTDLIALDHCIRVLHTW